jgi:[NiFe] hydrogenase assembly HybE family chaperone
MSQPAQETRAKPVRKRAFQAPQPAPALANADDPSALLASMYRRIWDTSMHDLPFVNPALSVEALGFRRWQGDWVGAVVTPWFINLFVVPGGGQLWSDLPGGDRCKIVFPLGELEFIADNDASAEIPAHQYCPLFAPPSQFGSQEAARAAAEEALRVLFIAPAPAEPEPSSTAQCAPDQRVEARRAFLRRVGGR